MKEHNVCLNIVLFFTVGCRVKGLERSKDFRGKPFFKTMLPKEALWNGETMLTKVSRCITQSGGFS